MVTCVLFEEIDPSSISPFAELDLDRGAPLNCMGCVVPKQLLSLLLLYLKNT